MTPLALAGAIVAVICSPLAQLVAPNNNAHTLGAATNHATTTASPLKVAIVVTIAHA